MSDELPSSSELLLEIKQHEGEHITVQELVTTFREGGFSLLLIIFCAPLALPLPALGIAQIMALPILLLSMQLAVGRKSPWVPEKIGRKRMKMTSMVKIVDTAVPWLQKLEYFLKPRLKFISTGIGQRFVGVACILCAISVAMPFPFSNTVPSMGIVIMCLGLLERDGLAIMGGLAVGAMGICLAIAVVWFGVEAVEAFFSWIKCSIVDCPAINP